jgi:uncharacterized protein (TIRG00374 family)
MKLAVNLALSLLVAGVCIYFVWPAPDQRKDVVAAFRELDAATVMLYTGTLALMHFFRAWRWEYLLRPLGARVPLFRLLLISSVGFMAILALPARLGEFVRPHLVKQRGTLGMSAALGTVAVERIVDGLLVSLMIAICCATLPTAPWWLVWVPLAVFGAATVFLVFGLLWPEGTVRFCIRVSLLERIWPAGAARISSMLRGMLSGFRVLGDGRNLAAFVGMSAVYWFWNGFGMWLLARGMDVPLPMSGAFVTMGVIVVGITLPNAPGLIGQFHAFTKLGLMLYAVPQAQAFAYATVLHGLQTIWYVGVGLLALIPLHASLGGVVKASQRPIDRESSGQDAVA